MKRLSDLSYANDWFDEQVDPSIYQRRIPLWMSSIFKPNFRFLRKNPFQGETIIDYDKAPLHEYFAQWRRLWPINYLTNLISIVEMLNISYLTRTWEKGKFYYFKITLPGLTKLNIKTTELYGIRFSMLYPMKGFSIFNI